MVPEEFLFPRIVQTHKIGWVSELCGCWSLIVWDAASAFGMAAL